MPLIRRKSATFSITDLVCQNHRPFGLIFPALLSIHSSTMHLSLQRCFDGFRQFGGHCADHARYDRAHNGGPLSR